MRALHGSWERRDQIGFQQRIIHHRARHQYVIGGHLGIGHHHRQFRPCQAFAGLRTLAQHVIAGQAFHLAVQSNTAFQRLDQPLEHRHGGCTAGFRQADGLRLQAVVTQHQFRNVVGHHPEQRIAIRSRQAAGGDVAVERDLDVDFVVGAIDAGRIVDEIGVDAPANSRELDTGGLGEAEIGAFANRLCLQRVGIHPDRIIGAVAGIGVTFGRRLHIGADAAEPDQIDLRLQDGAEQFAGRHCVHAHAQHGLHLGRKRDGFQAARKHAAAF